MAIHTTYTQARANLAKLCERATDDCETVIIRRRSAEDVALISAAELASLRETAYLLRSPRNAERLFAAVERAMGATVQPQTVEELRRELGLGEEKAG